MIGAVRRLLAILLFTALVLPFALPGLALAQGEDAGLPACCRRTGVHHCGMKLAERNAADTAVGKELRWSALPERCPFCPATLTVSHPNPLMPPATQVGFSESFGHPGGVAQTESKWRVARERSRAKRGPPANHLA